MGKGGHHGVRCCVGECVAHGNPRNMLQTCLREFSRVRDATQQNFPAKLNAREPSARLELMELMFRLVYTISGLNHIENSS